MAGLLDSFDVNKPTPDLIARGLLSRVDEHAQAVFAILPSFNRTHEFGPMPFANPNAAVGDSVLVAFDEQGSPWVISWKGALAVAIDYATQGELDAVEAEALAAQSDIDAHEALTTTAHGGIVSSADARLTDARTPTAHASTHASAGSDPITIAESQVTNLTSDLAAKAPLASPTFTGTPAAPTAAVDTSTTQVATTAFVVGQASAVGDGTPAMDGTAARGSSTHFARADHVHPTDTSLAPLASPALTGNPTAPTPAAGDNDTSIATTAFVVAALAGGMTRLYDTTLGADTASFDYSSIPSTYAHLLIVVQMRGTKAAATTDAWLRLNNDSGNNYEFEDSFAASTTIAGSTQTAQSKAIISQVPAASAGANRAGAVIVWIPNYAGSSFYKNLQSIGGFSGVTRFDSAQWLSTSAINRVAVLPDSGNWKAGSRMTVYGVG